MHSATVMPATAYATVCHAAPAAFARRSGERSGRKSAPSVSTTALRPLGLNTPSLQSTPSRLSANAPMRMRVMTRRPSIVRGPSRGGVGVAGGSDLTPQAFDFVQLRQHAVVHVARRRVELHHSVAQTDDAVEAFARQVHRSAGLL